MNHTLPSRPALEGGLLALAAALLFGLSTPLVQLWGREVGPLSTAALLYAGAAGIALFSRQSESVEAPVRRSDAGVLVAMALCGAVIGPSALAWGLQNSSATSASLLLTLEAVFTAILAWRIHGETMDRRVQLAVALLTAGGLVLVLDQGDAGSSQWLGLLAVAVATAAWGLDNTLSRRVADRDPAQVVMLKSTLGVSATLLCATLWGEHLPGWPAALGLLAVGATGYGLSLRLYLLAQRRVGAGRTGSIYAFAPFIGAIAAMVLGDRSFGLWMPLGGALMLVGVLVHLAERHEHEHEHEALHHEHAHRHDDGHHDHAHEPGQQVLHGVVHSHPHHHKTQRHAHPHAPDLHHQHRH